MSHKLIMVLNDGETFTNLDGCAIVAVPTGFYIEDIEVALDGEITLPETPVFAFDIEKYPRPEGQAVTVVVFKEGQP